MRLKEEFLGLLESEKEKRKRERKLNKGLKPKQFNEEGFAFWFIYVCLKERYRRCRDFRGILGF